MHFYFDASYAEELHEQIIIDPKKVEERQKEFIEILFSRDINIQDILEDVPQLQVLLIPKDEVKLID